MKKRTPKTPALKSPPTDWTELPHTPLIMEVTAKIIDQPFICFSSSSRRAIPADFRNGPVDEFLTFEAILRPGNSGEPSRTDLRVTFRAMSVRIVFDALQSLGNQAFRFPSLFERFQGSAVRVRSFHLLLHSGL
jgi:hypothetical protein